MARSGFLSFSIGSLLFLFSSFTPVCAQDASTGAIRGTVSDFSGSRIQNAAVTVVNTATGLRHAEVSDADGRFAFELLPPGDYAARAEAEGMSAQVSVTLHVEVAGVKELSFTLTIAGAKETVTVSGAPPL